jgi:YfiH family protein
MSKVFDFTRSAIDGKYLNHYENSHLCLGFTEKNVTLKDLASRFSVSKIVELKQIHSRIIRFSKDIRPTTEGDGIILTEPKTMAVIKTADCIPLFFWEDDYTTAGIIHIGWQGLLKGIEKALMVIIDILAIPRETLSFFLGPSIEKKCYEVGRDLFERFSAKSYRDLIFYPLEIQNNTKYLMDLRKGLVLALQELGIKKSKIKSLNLCNFCQKERFPSYRREKGISDRIYNFIFLKRP